MLPVRIQEMVVLASQLCSIVITVILEVNSDSPKSSNFYQSESYFDIIR